MFSVTYEIITPESAEEGDADERGFICEGASLREAVSDLFATRTAHCDGINGIEPSDSDHGRARWITVHNGGEYLTGAHESRALHMPESMTPARRRHLIRLLTA